MRRGSSGKSSTRAPSVPEIVRPTQDFRPARAVPTRVLARFLSAHIDNARTRARRGLVYVYLNIE
jgi:hypothetical protein